MRSCEDRIGGDLCSAAGLGAATIGFETQASLEVFSEMQQMYGKVIRPLESYMSATSRRASSLCTLGRLPAPLLEKLGKCRHPVYGDRVRPLAHKRVNPWIGKLSQTKGHNSGATEDQSTPNNSSLPVHQCSTPSHHSHYLHHPAKAPPIPSSQQSTQPGAQSPNKPTFAMPSMWLSDAQSASLPPWSAPLNSELILH